MSRPAMEKRPFPLASLFPEPQTRPDHREVSGFRTYLEVLEASGVRLHVAEFMRKTFACPHCGREIERWEEKETDVSLGVIAVELLHLRACDTLAIVSGDTDLAPAIRAAKRLFPESRLCVVFPYARFNAELQQLADFSFRIRAAQSTLAGVPAW